MTAVSRFRVWVIDPLTGVAHLSVHQPGGTVTECGIPCRGWEASMGNAPPCYDCSDAVADYATE